MAQQVPLSLLYSLLKSLGGSYSATGVDLMEYDPNKYSINVIQYSDPYSLSLVLEEIEQPVHEHRLTAWLEDKKGFEYRRCVNCDFKEMR